ncbi:MAG: DUF3473 domain-containing protein [Nostoc sp. TH1S01]|nr:DUF3473 domain-containing protein [Nostoc sp. TH1S01]
MQEIMRTQNAFTVDVEDWYHGIPIDETTKAAAECRLHNSLNILLDLLARYRVKGTFFWLAPVALKYPDLLQQVVSEGHEIGCHGWSHDLIYNMSPQRFREETERAAKVIADLIGKPITAYRAAYFSITKNSLWALEILAELGFKYDSSIFPVQNWRYGIPDFEPRHQVIKTPSGDIYELPMSVRRILNRNVPVSGGAYFRLYPYALTVNNFRIAELQGYPVVFYLHPWELDPNHPKISFNWKARFTHYYNLQSTKPKLEQLLQDFCFAPLGEVLDLMLEKVS